MLLPHQSPSVMNKEIDPQLKSSSERPARVATQMENSDKPIQILADHLHNEAHTLSATHN
jgi:hypothetical protein